MRSSAATSSPTVTTTASKSTFSSCSPRSALVAGVKIGSGSREPSWRPGGSAFAADPPGGPVVDAAPTRSGSRGPRTRPANMSSRSHTTARPATSAGTSGRDQVVGDQPAQLVEPPQRHPGQDLALVGDVRGEHEVEGREPVGRHHQQLAVSELIQVAHLAGVQVAGSGSRAAGCPSGPTSSWPPSSPRQPMRRRWSVPRGEAGRRVRRRSAQERMAG